MLKQQGSIDVNDVAHGKKAATNCLPVMKGGRGGWYYNPRAMGRSGRVINDATLNVGGLLAHGNHPGKFGCVFLKTASPSLTRSEPRGVIYRDQRGGGSWTFSLNL